jgi:AI-2 transport protein TqsA
MLTSPAGALSPALRLVLLTAGIAVTVGALRLAAAVLVPLALALFVTAISLPILRRLMARGAPAWLAVVVVLLIDLTVLLTFVSLLVRSFAEIGPAMPAYLDELQRLGRATLGWFAARGLPLDPGPYVEPVRTDQLFAVAGTFVRGATDAATTVFLVVLITVFLLLESTIFPEKLRHALGRTGQELEWLATVMTDVQGYLALKTLVSAATGLLIGLAAWALGVDFARLWGLLAFLLNFIPNVGSIVAAVPAVLVALLQLGAGPALALAGIYLAVNMLVGNVIEPALMGRRLGLSPLVVVLSLIFWGWVWGAVGMFLAVPLAMIIRIVLERTSGYRWIAVLMAGPAPRLPVSGVQATTKQPSA